jgi:hypothetical protein
MQTDIHVYSGIRTHGPSVWAGEDSSCLRPRGHFDQQQTQEYFSITCPWPVVEPGTFKMFSRNDCFSISFILFSPGKSTLNM